MPLGIAAPGHIEQNAAMPFLRETGVGEPQAKLCLADARGADQQRERAGQESASQALVERGIARGEPAGYR